MRIPFLKNSLQEKLQCYCLLDKQWAIGTLRHFYLIYIFNFTSARLYYKLADNYDTMGSLYFNQIIQFQNFMVDICQ